MHRASDDPEVPSDFRHLFAKHLMPVNNPLFADADIGEDGLDLTSEAGTTMKRYHPPPVITHGRSG
jgi:hypothetical protein